MTIDLCSEGSEIFNVDVWDKYADVYFLRIIEGKECIQYTSINLTYDSPIRFTFTAYNQYGMKTVTYHMPPVSYEDIPSFIRSNSYMKEIAMYELLNINGKLIYRTNSRENIFNKHIIPGLYILKTTDNKGKTISIEKTYLK